MLRAVLLLSSLAGMSFLAQRSDSNHLRGLTKSLLELPVDRVELKANPSVTFEGITAVASEEQGNIYVLHRPMDGDPVVVPDPAAGTMLGRVLARSHELAIGSDGTLLPASRNDRLLLFRPRNLERR
jgi:hypothetical protein